MSMSEMISRAAASTSQMIHSIEAVTPDAPTTCSEWDFAELANHLTGFLPYTANAARRGPAMEGEAPNFAADPNWATTFEALATDAAAAWSTPRALEGTVQFGSGDMPAQYAADITLMELVIHGWDLAHSTGTPYSVDQDIAATVAKIVDGAAANSPGGFFDSPQDAPADASSLEQAVATSGRNPRQAI